MSRRRPASAALVIHYLIYLSTATNRVSLSTAAHQAARAAQSILIISFNIVRGSSPSSFLPFRLEEYATLVDLSLDRTLVHRSLEGALTDQSADQGSESITKNETLRWKRPRIRYHIT
jgi:hypothetical protein